MMTVKSFMFSSLLCFTLLLSCQNQECNSTLLQYFTQYTIGNGDELNKTFTKIGERLSILPNVTHTEGSIQYLLYDIKPSLLYSAATQEIYIDDEISAIVVMGGFLQVFYDFSWNRNGRTQGTGRAHSRSDKLGFVKEIKLNTTYAYEQLRDYENVTFATYRTNITRIDPPNIQDSDLKVLETMFNSIGGERTVRTEIEEVIAKSYSYYLNLSLYDDRRIIDEFFEYKWAGPSSNLNIQYEVTMKNITLKKEGLTALYLEKIVNYTKWHCEHDASSAALNPLSYGTQEFITFDLINNTLRYAIENGALNTDLNRKNWESRFFQFFAGDLYEVLPKLSELYFANEVVVGSCKAVADSLRIEYASPETFNVTIKNNCELGIGRERIASFSVLLTTEIEGVALSKSLDFKVHSFSFILDIAPDQKFIVQNRELAQHMVMHSLNRLYDGKIFGSGWPALTRDYPHFIVQQKSSGSYLGIYDSSHVLSQETE